MFCRFYELDADRDGRLSGEDLIKYGEHGLSHLIVDRYDAPLPLLLVHVMDVAFVANIDSCARGLLNLPKGYDSVYRSRMIS